MIKNPNCANCSFVICKKNCPHPQNSSIKLLLRKIHDVIFTSTLANKTIEIFIYFICSCFCVQTFKKLIKHTLHSQTLKVEENKGVQDISSSGHKFESPKKSNFCPVELLSSNFCKLFFQFILKQGQYKTGRPFILKLVLNDGEWANKIA